MGWDLQSRKNKRYFRVSQYGWPRLRMTLEFLGADVSRMAEYNEGDYVPKRVAESWARLIEAGIDDLKMVTVKDHLVAGGEGFFIVPIRYDEKTARKLVREYYGDQSGKKDRVTFKRIEPLSKDMRRFLLDFAKYCRVSKGFEQW